MEKEKWFKCFSCGSEDIEVFEEEKIIIFRCNLCHNKWGKYNVRE